jgi:hypothetical protein
MGEDVPKGYDFKDLHHKNITWCVDEINDNDIPYISQKDVEKVAKWLLGMKGSFATRPENGGLYWWRTELREKLKELGLNF